MTETERLRWIDLVARATRIIITRNPVANMDGAQHWMFLISLMASMPPAFITLNAEQFREVERAASDVVRLNGGER